MHTNPVKTRSGFAAVAVAILLVSLFSVGLTIGFGAGAFSHSELPPGEGGLAGVRVQDRPDAAFETLQAAVDAAQAGDLVLVPASSDALDPQARIGGATIATPGLTLCASVAGSPICAEDMQAGHWQLSRSEWTSAPAPWSGEAVLLDGGTGWGSTSFFPPAGFQAQDLEALTLDLFILESTPHPSGAFCGSGAPRITLGVDTTGDGERDKNINVYNSVFSHSDCAPDTWYYVDFLDPATSSWDLGKLGGPNQATHAAALAWLDANPPGDVVAINAIVDNGAIAVIDNQRINGWVLGEEQDIACYWSQETFCRWEDTRRRTIVDGAGAATTLKVDAPDVTVLGLTITNSGDGPMTGVALNGDGALLRDNDITGPFMPLGHDGSATVNQVGLAVGGGGAGDILVTGNKIRGWGNIGVLLAQGVGAGNLIQDNKITQNRWHGILAEGPTSDKGPASVTVERNAIGGHGHSALRIGTQDPAVLLVRDNLFAITNVNAVTTQDRVEDQTIDVRLNDWQVYDAIALALRVDDESGTNHIQQVPFIDATGRPEPPAVTRIAPGAGGMEFLSIQEAADDAMSVAGTMILLEPARTAYPGAVIEQADITLCATSDGDVCGDTRQPVTVTAAAPGAPALTLSAEGIMVQGLLLSGASPVVLADGAHGLTLSGNSVLSEPSATAAQDGIRLFGSDDVRIDGNAITGNLYPGSIALGLQGSNDAVIRDNRIIAAGTAMWIDESTAALIERNRVLGSPVGSLGGDTLGISLQGGADHKTLYNTLYGVGTGLVVGGAQGVVSEGDEFLATRTGVEARASGAQAPYTQPEGLQVRNASLVGAVMPLVLDARTSDVEVDARCNDWGIYTATLIRGTRISDSGSGNTVDISPYMGPFADDGVFPFGCLRLPVPDFAFSPAAPAEEEPVTFTDDSRAGSRPIVERQWDFGDGATHTETFPFSDAGPTHTYDVGGAYLVVLTVTDAGGNQASSVQTIGVTGVPAKIVAPESSKVKAGKLLSVPIETVGLRGDVTMDAVGLPASAELVKLGNSQKKSNWRLDWTPEAHHVGTHLITLNAADAFGNLAIHELLLEIDGPVLPPREVRFAMNSPVPGPAIPGGTLTFVATVFNPDSVPMEVHLQPSSAQDWPTAMLGDDVIELQPGERRDVSFTVLVGDAVSSRVQLKAVPIGSPEEATTNTWNVRVPVEVTVTMTDTSRGDPIRGVVRVSYLDGSPASHRTVEWERSYEVDPLKQFGARGTGRTDGDGTYHFEFPTSDRGGQQPGTHTLTLDVLSPNLYRTVLQYTVGS